jgi:hypothetical protein
MLERQLPGGAMFVAHLDHDENRFRVVDARGDETFDLGPGVSMALNETFCVRMAAGHAPMLSDASSCPH